MPATHLDRLGDYQRRFAESITEVDEHTPIPTCGAWTARDLVLHLADIHTWAARRAGGAKVMLTPGANLAVHYRTAAAVLMDALRDLDPDEPCWTLLDDEVPDDVPRIGRRRFWHRRQALETMVHLWDLRAAVGLPITFSDVEWLDCADEVVAVLQPRQTRLGRIVPPQVRVVLVPTGAEPLMIGASDLPEEVVVYGTAEELALLLWGRRKADGLRIEGKPELLEQALAGIVP